MALSTQPRTAIVSLFFARLALLVHSYRQRFPETDRIVVETIHSGFAIYRGADQSAVRYSPPTRLRRYDLILIDEASQIEDYVTDILYLAIQELPQKLFGGYCS